MIRQTARLIRDCYPYKKGTEFLVTGEDDGMWSNYPFYSGTINGRHFSCEQKDAEILWGEEPTGFVEEMDDPEEKQLEWYETFP